MRTLWRRTLFGHSLLLPFLTLCFAAQSQLPWAIFAEMKEGRSMPKFVEWIMHKKNVGIFGKRQNNRSQPADHKGPQ
jgi:hypothetical protein